VNHRPPAWLAPAWLLELVLRVGGQDFEGKVVGERAK
jgi:hypothetical protein